MTENSNFRYLAPTIFIDRLKLVNIIYMKFHRVCRERGEKVKKINSQTLSKILFSSLFVLSVLFWQNPLPSSPTSDGLGQEYQIKKAKIYQEVYPVISESDLYCSFFILEERLELKIIGAEKEYEKTLLTDSDLVYVNQGKRDGLEEGQLFLVVEVGPEIKNFGHLAFKRGRARIQALQETKASAILERTCGQVMIGNFLMPFKEKEGILGKDLGYDVPPEEGEGLKGNIIYFQRGYQQIGSGYWALIDLGSEDGLQIGQQMIIYRIVKEGTPLQILGNLIIIDTQSRTSTVKILSCKDVLMLGDHVQTRTQ